MIRPSLLLSCCCLSLALGACAVGPDFAKPAAPTATRYQPDSDRGPATAGGPALKPGAAVADAWWRGFGSPTLDALMDKAVAGNQTLAAAQARLRAVQESAAASTGALWPQFDLNGGISRNRVNLVTYGMQGHSPIFNLYSLGATINYTLDLFGATRRQVEGAEARAEAMGYRAAGAYLMLTGNTATQAFTAAGASRAAAAAAKAVEADREVLRLTERGAAAGVYPRTAITGARAQLATDTERLTRLRLADTAARDALAVLLGVTPAEGPEDGMTGSLADAKVPADLPLTLPSRLVDQRPDILAAQADLHAASADVGVATANLYPRIQLSASITQAAALTSLFPDNNSTEGGVGAGVVAPIFHGGALRAARRAAQAQYQASLADYRQTVLTAFAQVADTLQALAQDGQALDAATAALDAARDNHRMMTAARQRGTIDQLALAAAGRDYQWALAAWAQADARRWTDIVAFYIAMGGDWRHWTAGGDADTAPASPATGPGTTAATTRAVAAGAP